MITLLRIDDRLIHGQVAFAWTKHLGVNCILVANDAVAQDELKKMMLNLAKPPGVKLLLSSVADAVSFLNSEEADKYKTFVLVDKAQDALALCQGVKGIKAVNVGGMRMSEGKKMISPAVAVNEADVQTFETMVSMDIEVEVRQVPTEKKKPIMELIG
ncbi:PTS system mannose/fructose/N-acetylgalactosamine-transporter subunit IIB [Brevibacillus sp. TJ4]|uniref:PTS system mannose/fructose/N-acetylgalactosamine-transporter subunit IIB n=1 Tax=Brevibacillus sp. TJ4 TaxID=3234853 RepID=UPI003BA1B36F